MHYKIPTDAQIFILLLANHKNDSSLMNALHSKSVKINT